MSRFLLYSINFIKIDLIVCLSIELIAMIGGLTFNVMNPNMKGVSQKDFGQLFVIISITVVLLFIMNFVKRKYNVSITK